MAAAPQRIHYIECDRHGQWGLGLEMAALCVSVGVRESCVPFIRQGGQSGLLTLLRPLKHNYGAHVPAPVIDAHQWHKQLRSYGASLMQATRRVLGPTRQRIETCIDWREIKRAASKLHRLSCRSSHVLSNWVTWRSYIMLYFVWPNNWFFIILLHFCSCQCFHLLFLVLCD